MLACCASGVFAGMDSSGTLGDTRHCSSRPRVSHKLFVGGV